MKQFTELQILRARERATPDTILRLITGNSDVINNPVLVPETGCATWNHYFFCPDHSVRLTWDRHSPEQHVCPVDGKKFSGEPYDGAWWRWLNGLNAKACYELGVLWLLTEDERYLNKVREILLGYARYYPDYQEHGGIPYNGPGKANAQTLCEANCHTDFARGFDLVRAHLSAEEEQYIASRLLCTGADFLMKHRCNQIHNHEVKIGAAIGIIGAVLDNDAYLDFAVNGKYGLRYQLEHAVMPDGLWFEGSLHYHYYALQGFFAFEKVAGGSEYSLLGEPYYRQMLSAPLHLLMPDMTLPRINDCVNGQERLTHSDIYEFAWWYYEDRSYGQLLKSICHHQGRNSIDALFYGKDLSGEVLTPPEHTLRVPQSGLTIIRPKPGRAICVKHMPYGGEHDHYNSLGLTVFDEGIDIFPDLGTTGYGAPLHYGYYKNSFSHNTLCINGKNQPPAYPRVVSYRHTGDFVQLITEVDWKAKPVLPDSKTRVEWDDDAYRDVVYRRNIIVTGDLLIDISTIDNPHGQMVGTSWLIDAEPCTALNKWRYRDGFYPHIRVADKIPLTETAVFSYQAVNRFTVYCCSPGATDLYQAKGPNNPSTADIEYLIMRSQEKRVVHIVVTDLSDTGDIGVTVENNYLNVKTDSGTVHRFSLS
ncbi:heparinase II/III domain-containing protein [Enterobacter cloacae]